MSMGLANMIEEKNLKKGFIIATLCSTLVGTFTSSMGLWDRVQDKRTQRKKDSKQDDDIKNLREEIKKASQEGKEREERIREDERKKYRNRSRDRDDVGDNFERSGALIQRQYDEGYRKMGGKFAQGDAITENQLQAQVINLQQTVINVLQDALANERQLTRSDMAKLTAAADQARDNSLEALRQQQKRLTASHAGSEVSSHTPPRSRAGSIVGSIAPPRRASTVIEQDPLFCRYSLDLQYIAKKPLAADFAPGGGCRCPACGLRLGVSGDDFWQIGKRTPIIVTENGYEKEIMETREFHLGQRFLVKCHTPDGEYACVLCSRHRDVDAICRSVESLVNHVGRYHDITELERDPDLKEREVPKRLALPAPPASIASMSLAPGATRRVEEVKEIIYR